MRGTRRRPDSTGIDTKKRARRGPFSAAGAGSRGSSPRAAQRTPAGQAGRRRLLANPAPTSASETSAIEAGSGA